MFRFAAEDGRVAFKNDNVCLLFDSVLLLASVAVVVGLGDVPKVPTDFVAY